MLFFAVIGPGAMNDTCLCLKSCEAKEDFRSFKDESSKEKPGKAYDLLTGHLTTTSGELFLNRKKYFLFANV